VKRILWNHSYTGNNNHHLIDVVDFFDVII
jgi:hypothetical protein